MNGLSVTSPLGPREGAPEAVAGTAGGATADAEGAAKAATGRRALLALLALVASGAEDASALGAGEGSVFTSATC